MSVEQVIDCLILFAALFVAVIAAALGLGPVKRLVAIKSSRIADLKPGVAEVTGTARLTGAPLQALDGTPLVATRRESHLDYQSTQSRKRARTETVREIAYAPFEVVDESGSCAVEVDTATVIGPSKRWRFSADSFKEKHPDLYEKLNVDAYSDPGPVYVEEVSSVVFPSKGKREGHLVEAWINTGQYNELKRTMVLK